MTPKQELWVDLKTVLKKHNKKICVKDMAAINLRLIARVLEESNKDN